MTPDQLLLARLLSELSGFRWTQGMRNVSPDGSPGWWTHTGGSERSNLSPWYGHGAHHDPSEGVPDLTDDATGGVLLGGLAAMDRPTAFFHGDAWTLDGIRGSTLAEACARALVTYSQCAPTGAPHG